MTTLIERLERAEGPTYALECEIGRAAGFDFKVELGGAISRSPPRYMSSIDAALTLVPEGWDGALYLATETSAAAAQLETPAMRERFSMDYEGATGTAATLALALCIAALKAREASNG